MVLSPQQSTCVSMVEQRTNLHPLFKMAEGEGWSGRESGRGRRRSMRRGTRWEGCKRRNEERDKGVTKRERGGRGE